MLLKSLKCSSFGRSLGTRVVYFHKACYCYCMALQDIPLSRDASTNLEFSAFGRSLGTRVVYFHKACYCYCMALQDIPLSRDAVLAWDKRVLHEC